MPTRWEITKAVRASDLPSPARLIMLVLADVAEVGTAEIPKQFTPSVSVLADETGLSKRTVQTHLSALEADGWIGRTRPPTPEAMWRGDRVRYRLSVPDGQMQETHDPGAGDAHPSEVAAPPLVQEMHQGGAGDAPLGTDPYQITSDQEQDLSSAMPTRPDVERICEHLADKIEQNGSKRPKITQRWRVSARLLLDADGKTVEQVTKAIDWCQADEFWRANVMSMTKLREKYDQLRLAAQRPLARASPNGQRQHHGLMLNDRTIADLERRNRMAALEAQHLAIEGPS